MSSLSQVPLPKTAADVSGPAAGNAMTKAYVEMVGRMAYVWGYALVNSHNRRAAFAYVTGQNGNVPGWNGGVVPMAPVGQNSMLTDYIKPEQTFVACPNQDVVYGAGFSALDKEPTVFQVPDFGDRFWVYALYDARTDEFARIGKPYGTTPGFCYRDFDSQGRQLHGRNLYTVTFPKGQQPPVKGFWSLTLYNEHHLFHPNALNRYSLGTKSKSLHYNPDGSLTLYFGATSPGKDKESNWLPAPDGTFSLYIRAYWAEQAILDGAWMAPNVEKVT